jgi:hypothetical protein
VPGLRLSQSFAESFPGVGPGVCDRLTRGAPAEIAHRRAAQRVLTHRTAAATSVRGAAPVSDGSVSLVLHSAQAMKSSWNGSRSHG